MHDSNVFCFTSDMYYGCHPKLTSEQIQILFAKSSILKSDQDKCENTGANLVISYSWINLWFVLISFHGKGYANRIHFKPKIHSKHITYICSHIHLHALHRFNGVRTLDEIHKRGLWSKAHSKISHMSATGLYLEKISKDREPLNKVEISIVIVILAQ